MTDWHGWSRSSEPYTGESLHIGRVPGRKRIALYSVDYCDGSVMHVHAYFRSEDKARAALGVLDRLLSPPADEAKR